jgi:hypothetical protein
VTNRSSKTLTITGQSYINTINWSVITV